jgi:hypothetical protein
VGDDLVAHGGAQARKLAAIGGYYSSQQKGCNSTDGEDGQNLGFKVSRFQSGKVSRLQRRFVAVLRMSDGNDGSKNLETLKLCHLKPALLLLAQLPGNFFRDPRAKVGEDALYNAGDRRVGTKARCRVFWTFFGARCYCHRG